MSEATEPSAPTSPTSRYRRKARTEDAPRRYAGWSHFAFTSSGALCVIAAAASQVEQPTALELLVVPASFFLANLVEYLAHRGPMHHPTQGPLKRLFTRHQGQHHRFFTHDAMVVDGPSDFFWVLFPPVMLLFFLGIVAAPIAALLFALATPNVAWLYVTTAVGYFLTYEWLHFTYHLPEDSPVGRLPVVGWLRRHHTTHHDLRLMREWNFNITFPICDALFGTTWTPARAAKKRPS